MYLKREDLQVVRSYKLRGAYNLMSSSTTPERAAGVVCASAGNHAQGVAFACRTMGIRGRIYLPANTPRQKRDRIRAHGGEFVELIPIGDTYDAAAAAAADDVAAHRRDDGAAVRRPAHRRRARAPSPRRSSSSSAPSPDTVSCRSAAAACIAGIATYLHERAPRTPRSSVSSRRCARR